jgi:hypothetical protein
MEEKTKYYLSNVSSNFTFLSKSQIFTLHKWIVVYLQAMSTVYHHRPLARRKPLDPLGKLSLLSNLPIKKSSGYAFFVKRSAAKIKIS